MRVVAFITYYAPHWTGLTRHAQLLCEGLAERGHEVTVVTSHHRRDLPLHETLHGVRVVRLRPVARISRGMVCPSLYWRIAGLLRGADIVHLHSPLSEASYVALWARILGKRIVITHHADLVLPVGIVNRFIAWAVHLNLHIASLLCHRLVAYSDDYAAYSRLLSRFPGRVTAISPPVEIPEPIPERVRALRRELGLDGMTVIYACGRFVEEKGWDYLLAAIPYLGSRLGRFKIIFSGEYDTVAYERFYESMLPLIESHRESMQFLGLVTDRQRLAELYALADVLSLPSRSECFALVQAESMLCGTPVVASDVPGGRVPVRTSGMGKTVPPGDPAALADAIAEVVAGGARYVRPRREIEDIFSLDRAISRYLQTYLEAAGRRPAGVS